MFIQKNLFHKIVALFLAAVFTMSDIVFFSPVYAQSALNLPAPGTMVRISEVYHPAVLCGVKVDVNNPLLFDFILDKGDSVLQGQGLIDEGQKLIKYFLTALTVPENELWVNLSPYEGNRILPEQFGYTTMGRDLLAQDYILKQLTASLSDPNSVLGQEFWKRIYDRAQKEFGTTDIPMNAFNKVWVMPDKAVIYENGSNAYIVQNRLKVMMEQDYLSLQNNKANAGLGTDRIEDSQVEASSKVSALIVREIIIPELTKEINEGKNFANLRQVYNSLLLSAWYRRKVRESILGSTFLDKNKIAGDELSDKTQKEQIYKKYVEAFRKGAYNIIKEDIDANSQEVIPRKYFSGGAVTYGVGEDFAQQVDIVSERTVIASSNAKEATKRLVSLHAAVQPGGVVDNAMTLKTATPTTVAGMVSSLSARKPDTNILSAIRQITRQELRSAEIPQLVTWLRNSLSWREGNYSETAQTLKELVGKLAEFRQTSIFAPNEVLQAIRAAKADVGLGDKELKVVVIADNNVTFGVARINDMVYIEDALVKKILTLSNPVERFRALVAQALAESPDKGLLGYWDKAKERLGTEKALALFSMRPQDNPSLLIDNFEALFYGKPTDQRYVTLKQLFDQRQLTFPTITPGSKSEELIRQTMMFVRWTAAQSLMNFITGEVQTAVRPLFAFAGSPTTNAHMLSVLVTDVVTKSQQGDFDLTGDDFRKLVLSYNKSERKTMNGMVASNVGDMLALPEEFDDLNGEERADQKMVREQFKYTRDYIYGTDHHRTLDKKRFGSVSASNAKDFWYYYRKPGIVYVLQALIEHQEEYGITPEELTGLQKVLASMKDAQSRYQAIKETPDTHYMKFKQQGAEGEVKIENAVHYFMQWLEEIGVNRLPLLDVVPKQWLNNMNLFGSNAEWKIGLAALPRETVMPDSIRDAMIAGTLRVEGNIVGRPMRMVFVPMPEATNKVSSTASRNALLQLLLAGEISEDNLEGFFSIPTEGWKYILENDVYRASLLNDQKMPFSAKVVSEMGGRQAIQALQAQFPASQFEVVAVMKTEPGKESEIDSFALRIVNDGEQAFDVQIQSSLREVPTEAGQPRRFEFKNFLYDSTKKLNEVNNRALKEFLLKFNDAVDAAQADMKDLQERNEAVRGGIDFDLNNVDLTIQANGPEIQFKFDPAMLNNGNFNGLVPVILNVTPISDLPMFLGSKEDENKLAGVAS